MNFDTFKVQYQKKVVEEFPHHCDYQTAVVRVCVITYNHLHFIRQCLDGILMQKTDFPFEIYLGDDASTDGTREICMEYATKFPNKIRLLLHCRENNISIEGRPTGRFNLLYGYLSTSSKYIALCEGDDYWTDENKLQKQFDYMEKNTAISLCVHDAAIVSEFGVPQSSFLERFKNRNYDDLIGLEQVLRWKVISATCSYFFRNQGLQFSDKFTKVYGADAVILVLLSQVGPIKFLKENMSAYRLHANSLERSFDKLAKSERNINEEYFYLEHVKQEFKAHFLKKIIWNRFYLVVQYTIKLRWAESLKHFFCMPKEASYFMYYAILNIRSAKFLSPLF